MQFVRKPDRFGSDAIIPGRVADEDGFVDVQNTIDGLRGPVPIYLSVSGLRLIAERYPQVGLASRTAMSNAADLAEARWRQVQELEARNAELETQLERISGLAADGFTVVRKQGRPPKKAGD